MKHGALCVALGVCLTLIAAAGCNGKQAGVKPTEGAKPYAQPMFEVRKVAFEEQSFAGCQAAFKLELVSTDERPAAVTGCTWSFTVEGLEAAGGELPAPGELAAQGKLPLEMTARATYPTEDQALFAFLEKPGAPYRLAVTCKLDTPGGPLQVEALDTGALPLPRLPRFTVSDANVERYSASEARVNFDIALVNDNTFSIHIKRLVYKVFLEERPVGEGDLDLGESIPANNETAFEVNTPAFSDESDKELFAKMRTGSLGYRLEGILSFERFTVPLKADGTINFSAR
ncbi:MAG TPA: LEA type 2 family protein [Myxococcota bacterium]|nr:LEA type 2 family protein [Myxococcota bacterium]HRY92607.1 LEA type 2 family protein [Myxococcota bacterium]HSA20621.1 LEA type 2 family protein [Myxococcota bacterium]